MMAEIEKKGAGAGRYRGYVQDVLRTYLPAWLAQQDAALSIDPYLRGEHPLPVASAKLNTKERDQLRYLASTPHARLLLNSSTQALNLRGIREPGSDEIPPMWKEFWVRNRMPARQNAIHRSAIAYGCAYSSVLPGQLGIKGEDGLVLRTFTPKTMTAFYQEVYDEYPVLALNGVKQVDSSGRKYWMFEIFDDEAVHFAAVYDIYLNVTSDMKVVYIESRPHGCGVTPVVYHSPLIDDDGGSRGEIVPFLPVIKRLDQSVYDRLLIQRQAAWKTRTAAGVKTDRMSETAVREMRATMSAGDLLTSDDPTTKFGTLDASSMLEHVETRNSDLRDLATASQTPAWMLTGESANVQAEGLSAITSGYQQRIEQYKRALGISHIQNFDLAKLQKPEWGEVESGLEARWAEFRPYSLTQISDALGKLSQQLQIDPALLYEYVPFFSDDDVERASERLQEMKDEALAMAQAEAAQAQEGGGDPTSNGNAQRKREQGTAGDSNQNSRS